MDMEIILARGKVVHFVNFALSGGYSCYLLIQFETGLLVSYLGTVIMLRVAVTCFGDSHHLDLFIDGHKNVVI